MAAFEDYYEILQVHPSAEPEVIEAAYKKLAQKYHPDKNKSPTAAEKMKRINAAHDVLSDPVQRKRYHAEWLQRKGGGTKPGGAYATNPPKPVVKPSRIRFANMEPGKTKRTSFIIQNAGGPYTRIWFSNPNSWVRVVDYRSMTASEELPLEVVIEARGLDWGESATEHIRVKLDEEETIVTAEIQTKPKPAAKPKPAPKSQPKQQQRGAARKPSPTIKWPSKRKLKIAAYVIGGLVVLVTVPLILINILSKHEYDQPAQSGDNKAEETVAPDFTLQATSGEKVTLSKFRGQPVILAFWHICPSSGCKVQESVLQAFYEKQTYGSLKLITVNVGGSPLEVEQYAAKNNLTFPILLDTNWDVSHDYGPFGSPIGFPRTVFIDARGYITTYRMGPFKSLDDIEKAVDSIWPSLTKTPYQSHQGQIAFASDRDGNEEIYVMNADGSGQMRLTFDPAEDG